MRTLILFFCLINAAFADCEQEENLNPDFAKSLRLAKKGNVIEQRNVAISYEIGYLTSRCYQEAYRWYSKAAEARDAIAIAWIDRQDVLIRLHDGPEFYTLHREPKLIQIASPSVQPRSVGEEQPKERKPGKAEQMYYSLIFGGL